MNNAKARPADADSSSFAGPRNSLRFGMRILSGGKKEALFMGNVQSVNKADQPATKT